MAKILILYRAHSTASFCDAFLASIAHDHDADLIPLRSESTVPDTSAYKEVVDVRDMDPWVDFKMELEPAFFRYKWVVDYAHDRDFRHPSSREVQATLRTWPHDREFWMMVAPRGLQEPFSQGEALLRAAQAHLSFDDLLHTS